MPHIHTAHGQHDHTVSVYLIRTDLDEPKVMLHLHKKFNRYAQFGGHIELHETPWEAIAHELEEESGYTLNDVEILQAYPQHPTMTGAVVHPQPVAHITIRNINANKHAHTDIAYVFTASMSPPNNPAVGESTDIRLFTQQEIATLESIDPITKTTAVYIFNAILNHWQPVSTNRFEL